MTGLRLEELSQLMQKLAIRLIWLEIDKVSYEEEKLYARSALWSQLFLKTKLAKEITRFAMPCLELVTLETLIAQLKEKDVNDLLAKLSVFSDEAIELYVPETL